jgi:ferritin-like metal-binding protein YciE
VIVFSIDPAFIVCYTIIIMTKLDTAEMMRQKFILELNGALAMENSGIERLQTRISETIVPEAKQQMQLHLDKSKLHIVRLNQLINSLGGRPYQGKLALPLPKYPQPMIEKMNNSMTKPEWELKRSEEDLISESAESVCYLMLIQKAQMAGGVFQNAIEPLSLNMKDEENMAEWIKTNTPLMLDKLWPQIEDAIASSPLESSPATSSQSQ